MIDQTPIFVGGLSRCGKTMMSWLLAAHPNIAMPLKESNMWTFFYGRYGNLDNQHNFERCLEAMLRYKGVQFLEPDPARIRKEFWQGEHTYARLFALFHIHYAERLGKPRWGVQSVSQESFTDHIFEVYPQAKVIQMIRDPRDRHQAKTDRRSGRWQEAAIAAAHWIYSANLAADYQKQYPHNFKVVRYEDLVSRPEETMRDVCDFVNEVYTPDIFTIRSSRYRDKDISTDFIGHFRQLMTKREIVFMQTYARKRMRTYNYEFEPVEFSLGERLLFYLFDYPVKRVYTAGWRMWMKHQDRVPRWRQAPTISGARGKVS